MTGASGNVEDSEASRDVTFTDNNDGIASYGTINNKAASQTVGEAVDDEEQALLRPRRKSTVPINIAGVLLILLLGEFIAAADTTLIFASGATLASEFKSLGSVNWLSTAYTMGVCACQPTLGKLSDIYGRKPVLLASCFFFAAGCFLCGMGMSMNQVILGRAVTGIGGGGLMSMASLIIADVVDRRDLALWRSYDNLSVTLGRSLGGPIGGLLTDSIGWRWLFHVQIPLILIAALLVSWKLELPRKVVNSDAKGTSTTSNLCRIDFLGATTFAGTMITGMFLAEMGTQQAWSTPILAGMGTLVAVLFIAFVFTEAYVAQEPIFLLRLLRNKDVVLSYAVMAFQIVAQFSLMFFVPLYFQIAQRASPTKAGLHLVPAVVGNAVGGLLAGALIRRTGRYKTTAVSAGVIASVTYFLLLLRWNGKTGALESLYIIPGGFGTSLVLTAVFVSMTAAVTPEELAMCTSGLFLVMHLAMLVGITGSNSVLMSGFRTELQKVITGPDASKIIDSATSDTSYISHLTGALHEAVASCYISALRRTYIISFISSICSSTIALFLSNRQL